MNPLQPYQYEGKDRFADFPLLSEGQYAMKRSPSFGCEADQIHVRWHNESSLEWLMFESLSEAVAFAEAEVIAHPVSACEIYDFDRRRVHSIWMEVNKRERTVHLAWNKVLRENAPPTECPACAQLIEAKLAHDADRDEEHRKWYAALAERLGLALGIPTDPAERACFDRALQHLRSFWTAEGGQAEVIFEEANILSSPRWWFIPFGWVGCCGFIVSRENGHVNQIGSGGGLELGIWAHDHGIDAEETDFVIHEVGDMDCAQALVTCFFHPSSTAEQGRRYTKQEAGQALQVLPAKFLAHSIWFWAGAIREAAEAGAITFSACPALHSRKRTGEWEALNQQ